MPGFIRGKSGARNWPARKSKKREDSDDCLREINPPQRPKTPKRQSRKNQSIRNSELSRGKSLSILGTNYYMAEAEQEAMRVTSNPFSQMTPALDTSEQTWRTLCGGRQIKTVV